MFNPAEQLHDSLISCGSAEHQQRAFITQSSGWRIKPLNSCGHISTHVQDL